jgi:hypothetical protein
MFTVRGVGLYDLNWLFEKIITSEEYRELQKKN